MTILVPFLLGLLKRSDFLTCLMQSISTFFAFLADFNQQLKGRVSHRQIGGLEKHPHVEGYTSRQQCHLQ